MREMCSKLISSVVLQTSMGVPRRVAIIGQIKREPHSAAHTPTDEASHPTRLDQGWLRFRLY